MKNKQEKKLKEAAENTKAVAKTDDNKELAKKEDKKAEVMRGILKAYSESVDYSDYYIKEFFDLLEKKELKELTVKEKAREGELSLEIGKANGLKNGLWAANLSYGKYHKFLGTTRSMLVKEYDCKTPIELMLADRIVANYWRSMRLDTTLNFLIEKEEGGYSFTDQKVNIVRELSKGLESASRQLNTSILLLKELKQPKLNVKINTDNAFIGQNQQFNTGKPPETT